MKKKRRKVPTRNTDRAAFGHLACFKDLIVRNLIRPALISLGAQRSRAALLQAFNERFSASLTPGVLKVWLEAADLSLAPAPLQLVPTPPQPSADLPPAQKAPPPGGSPPPRKDEQTRLFDNEPDQSLPNQTINSEGRYHAPGIGVVGGLLPPG